jgi:CheY-like chemotaxis protein
VAEDNEVNQIVFTQILDEMGLNYRIVDNGGSAYDTWKSHRPAIDSDGCLHAGHERPSGDGRPSATAEAPKMRILAIPRLSA